MVDMRLWGKSLITEMLQIYKSHPCLWKIKSDEYKNKHLKDSAYEILVKFCKDNGMPDANRDYVVKKIQSLKGSFRKEQKKVVDSQRTSKNKEDIYKPNLWYYDLLLFTKDQELSTDNSSLDEQDDDDFTKEDERFIKKEKQYNTSTSTDDPDFNPRRKKPALKKMESSQDMSDLRLWGKSFITKLLQIYRSYPCLWKIKSPEYKNKKLKENAYGILVDFCKEHGLPQANRDFVVKKIQSLKGSFRKELKKVMESQRNGNNIYKPYLWYYELLLFTKDQESSMDSISNDDENEDEHVDEDCLDEESDHNPFENIEEQEIHFEEAEVEDKDPYLSPKRKRRRSETELLKVYADTLKATSKELSEFDAVGINTAKKLAKMDPLQAIYAEHIINNVLRRGLLKNLTEDTSLCDERHRNVESSSNV